MECLEHNLSSTHRLVAILIINIPETTYHVDRIVGVLSKNADNLSMLRTCLSNLLTISFRHTLPRSAYVELINSYALDEYYFQLSCSREDVAEANDLIHGLITIIKSKVGIIINSKGYGPVSNPGTHEADDRIYIVSKIDLEQLKTIEFRFYDKEARCLT